MPTAASEKTVGRLTIYRRLLDELVSAGTENVYSHELATMSGCTAAQVRRDLMAVGYSGTPTRGYNVRDLLDSIGKFLDDPAGQQVALVGVGNLGRAILAYFAGRRPKLRIVAAFDNDPYKVGRVIHGCRCYGTGEMPDVIREQAISVGIITVPATAAQTVADQLVRAGIRGILNFAPATLRVPPNVSLEHNDITMYLEKVSYFARQGNRREKKERQGD